MVLKDGQMLSGYIDGVTSSGYIEGWAYDTHCPSRPLALSIREERHELANGVANRYRADLVDAGIGFVV